MNFFKTLIAATLGTLIALLLIFFVGIITISTSSQQPEPYIQSNSILKISLSGMLPSQDSQNPLDQLLNQSNNDKVSLETLKENLAKAQVHDNVEGIWLEIDFMSESWANLQEAHRLISAFRDSSDKFIYASTNDLGYNEKGYYLATATDSVFAPPETFFEFDGFFSQVTFFDGMFEKLGIDAEVIRHGKYKGAVEPFFRKDLSDENEYQLTQILNQTSTTFLDAVSAKTGHSTEELNQLLNRQPNLTTQFGFENQLIDSLVYTDELVAHMKNRIGLDESASIKTVDFDRYSNVTPSSAGLSTPSTSNKIAVIYANGPIMPDVGSNSPFNNQSQITVDFIEEQLEEIRKDDDIKALVLRISSPGGSGSTSDAIWRKLQETKKEIPVIVSMGGVAASGGYYIAMAGDSIVAEPTTITGSIGVFGTKFNTKQLMNEKLGITFDEVKTHEHADWLLPTREFTASEEKAFQQYIDSFYQTFITKAAEGRDMEVDEMDELAQGRVWVGADAHENGLVDELGGLEKALSLAAEKAEISDYKIAKYPKAKTIYEMFMGSAATQAKALLPNSWLFSNEMQNVEQQFSVLKRRDALTLFPYEISIQ
ncbi:signal peptide peptidase SppA [Aliifodinibius salipaludis]|uniref:Signal peptide peptidase SppA n=1 Tax=Fodinibius salipaludis TaxID=2032627 RepID=A0A2A2G6R1_9BACT|nr:signal peptide peptidase SppA [Aliifodinibius salipaludis]PAU93321.1 signal peptide peptidase SppA [Aliifodinibius salipaludis]